MESQTLPAIRTDIRHQIRSTCKRCQEGRKAQTSTKKAVRFYQIIHKRIKNKRTDFLHKLSPQYAKKHDIIFVERLAKLNMVRNHSLARNILDSGCGIFTNMLDYKTMLVEVPANTTIIHYA
ncbi:MAG: hypothetical protein ACK4TO_00385 [Candidatus Nitrosotenuis sp.]